MRLKIFFFALLLSACANVSDDARCVILMESYPNSLDPRIGTDQASARFAHLVFEGLVRVNDQGETIPALAERWEMTDKQIFVFYLRKNAYFHNGEKVGAEDVKSTYEEFLKPEFISAKKEPYEVIAEIDVLDEHSVRFRLKRPFSPFLNLMSLGITPSDYRQTAANPIGAGPFAMASAKKDANIVLRSHDKYYEGAPPIASVELRVVPDATSRALELRKGAAHIAVNNILPSALKMFEGKENFSVIKSPGGNFTYIAFNLKDPILQNPKVRQAIAHTINRSDLIEGLLAGLAVPAQTPIPPHLWAHAKNIPAYDYDTEKSRRLLDEAGYFPDADGKRFRLVYKTSSETSAREKAILIQEQLRAVGIDMEIRSYEFATFYEDIRKGNFQIFSLTWVGINDPDLLYYMFHSSNIPPKGANRGYFQNAEVDKLLELAREEFDTSARKEYYNSVQQIIARELPYISLWYSTNVAVLSSRVKNFHLLPSAEFYPLKETELR